MRYLVVLLPIIAIGCSATEKGDAMSPPLVCSLSPEDLRDRRDALLPGLIHRADRVTDLDNGLRLEFRSRPGILTEIARIMEQERGCCTFLRFNLTAEAEDGPIIFDVTGPKGTRDVLRSL